MKELLVWVPTLVGALILAAVGFALDFSIKRDERREPASTPPDPQPR